MNDPLEGFRGPVEGTTSPEEDPAAKLRERLGEDAELVAVVQFGAEMEEWCQNHPVGRYIYSHCAHTVAESTAFLFQASALDSSQARLAHFNGRVACAMLKLIDKAILAGQEAGKTISAADGSTPEDPPDGEDNG